MITIFSNISERKGQSKLTRNTSSNLVKYFIDVVDVVNSISHALEQLLIFHQGHLVTLASSNVEVELRQNFCCPLNSMCHSPYMMYNLVQNLRQLFHLILWYFAS